MELVKSEIFALESQTRFSGQNFDQNLGHNLEIAEFEKKLLELVEDEALRIVPFKLALRLKVLPIKKISEQTLTVMIESFANPASLQELKVITGLDILSYEWGQASLEKLIYLAYHTGRDSLPQLCQDLAIQEQKTQSNEKHFKYKSHSEVLNSSLIQPEISGYEDVEVSEEEIPQLLRKIISIAIRYESSDIHLEPYNLSSLQSYRLRIRKDGELRVIPDFIIGKENSQRLIRRIKILMNGDLSESYKPQEGVFQFTVSTSLDFRLRVSILKTQQAEKVVIRLLNNSQYSSQFDLGEKEKGSYFQSNQGGEFVGSDFMGGSFMGNGFGAPDPNTVGSGGTKNNLDRFYQKLSNLGLADFQILQIFQALNLRQGTILLSGPTGSGKTTLLYSCLNFFNSPNLNILSIEDPVEQLLPGINQIPVDFGRNLSFETYLKASLRQDPDIIMVGELRDKETAQVCLTASITGHLALSTVHAGNCLEIFVRLLEIGISPLLLYSSLSLLVSQRLFPRNCPNCLEEQLVTNFDYNLYPYLRGLGIERFFQAKGCPECDYTGIKGRIGVYEMLPITENLKEQLPRILGNSQGVNLAELKNFAISSGYVSIKDQLPRLIESGMLSIRNITGIS